MSKNRLITVILVMILAGVILTIINVLGKSKVGNLVGSNFQQIIKTKPVSSSSPVPQTPSYNPPKEFHFGAATDLQAELDSVNPKVLDGDFKDLTNLTDSLKSL